MSATAYISPEQAAKRLGLCAGWVREMCHRGVFKTAHRPGVGHRAKWLIALNEVVDHKMRSHVNQHEN